MELGECADGDGAAVKKMKEGEKIYGEGEEFDWVGRDKRKILEKESLNKHFWLKYEGMPHDIIIKIDS